MLGSRNQFRTLVSSRTSTPASFRAAVSWAHTSSRTSSFEQYIACLGCRTPPLLPVGDIDREDAFDAAVAHLLEIEAIPELGLRDGGERPGGIDVDRVAVPEPNVSIEVEHDPVHPPGPEPMEPGQARLGLL